MTCEIILDSDNSREVECDSMKVGDGMLMIVKDTEVVEMWNLSAIMGVIKHED